MSEQVTRPRHGRPTILTRLRSRITLVLVATAAAVAIGGYSLSALQSRSSQQQLRADHAEAELELTRANAVDLAAQMHEACDRQGEVAELLGDLCQRAQQVAAEPAQPVAIPPTEEQLRPLVQQYVEQWLRANPPRDGQDGETPSIDLISGLIAAELAANPPQDGRTPTAEEIRPLVASEVAAFLAANPPPAGPIGPAGPPGVDGTDGIDGTDGQPPLFWTFEVCGPLGCQLYRCDRVDPFDPAAPSYTCAPQDDPEPPENPEDP